MIVGSPCLRRTSGERRRNERVPRPSAYGYRQLMIRSDSLAPHDTRLALEISGDPSSRPDHELNSPEVLGLLHKLVEQVIC